MTTEFDIEEQKRLRKILVKSIAGIEEPMKPASTTPLSSVTKVTAKHKLVKSASTAPHSAGPKVNNTDDNGSPQPQPVSRRTRTAAAKKPQGIVKKKVDNAGKRDKGGKSSRGGKASKAGEGSRAGTQKKKDGAAESPFA